MTLPAPVDDVTNRSATQQSLANIDNELAELASRVATLAESMRVLRSRRNSLIPIACLPPEILATIFGHVEKEESFKRYPRGCHRRHPCMIVTHVCRYWRRVALECPSLWTYINWASARMIGIKLERSKKAALVVRCNISQSRGCLEQVLSHLPRIKILQLESYMSDVNRALDHLSSHPAPLLQVFKFSVIGSSFRQAFGPISGIIFKGRAPQLRSLELLNCSFSWTSYIFCGLQTLCIKFTTSSTLSELLPALRRMPGLERLTIERLSIISGGDKVLFDRVPLARLRSMVLEATIQTAVALFTHLALPDDADIALNLTKIEGLQNFSDLFSAMDKVPGKFGPVVRSVRASISPLQFVVKFSKSMRFESLYSWNVSDDDIRLSIRFVWDSSVTIHSPIIFDICQMVTQGKIHTLFVSSSKHLDTYFWRTGSANLPDLEEIHVSSSFIGDLLAVLRIEGTQSTDIAFQSLRVLNLEDIDFQESDPCDLHDIINMRGGLCASLSVLRLADCRGLTVDSVELLENVVENVEWDGHEESLESDSDSHNSCRCYQCGGSGSEY